MDYRTALITGAGSGIGRELALRLAQEGVAIAAVDLNSNSVQALADELARRQQRCVAATADVTQADALREKIAALESQLGPIDLLIASAGLGLETSALAYRAADINAVLGVNLLGVSNSVAAVLPGMLQRRRGHVVALSSLASYMGMPRMLGYCASKAGLNALMEGLRFEVKPFGVHVTTICPGWIRTPMTERLAGHIPMMQLDRAAARILDVIHRKQVFAAFPASLVWQLRILRWSPGFVRDWLVGKMQRRAPASVEA